ncbi:MAG: DUF1501 domain-containing protein [Phycisphaerales bacterium]|nr:DUF1501 domain-containing protein [Phycisphaerales bacterium]
MIIKRKQFLKISSLAAGSLLVPNFLHAFANPQENINNVNNNGRVLVVIQMSGGNDGLNTVIPIKNDIYFRLRPLIHIPADNAIYLTDQVALHPDLPFLADLYHQGYLGILNNVGYPNPDRSHFRSMDIWQTASDSNQYLNTGWLGRYLDTTCNNNCPLPIQAIEIDDQLSLAMKGHKQKGLAFLSPELFNSTTNKPLFKDLAKIYNPNNHEPEAINYLCKTFVAAINSAPYILKESKIKPTATHYPKSGIGNALKNIASLINSPIDTHVYYVSLGSFDTHVNQQERQKQLFKQLNEALAPFVSDLQANNRFKDVLIMTFSEFGRRVAENASKGTDHGTANTMFFIGGGLKQNGLINSVSDLGTLDNGDLIYQIDFKDVYATVLKKWLGIDDTKILNRQSTYLEFV